MTSNLVNSVCVLQISIINKAFLWMQGKTATTLAVQVLKEFDFKNYRIVDGKANFGEVIKGHHHNPCFFEGHEDFTFISTIRNPYQQVFSDFPKNGKQTKVDFKEHVERKFQLAKSDVYNFWNYSERFPDYILRVEKLYEDYLEIPFIKNSELAKSGGLKRIIDSNPNKTPLNYSWKDFYDQNIADLVYYNTSSYFDLFKYDKNSWKK